METIFSRLEKFESSLKKKYPGVTWRRTKVMEKLDENNYIDYYEVYYRLFTQSGRWNATVTLRSGEEPKLKKVWR